MQVVMEQVSGGSLKDYISKDNRQISHAELTRLCNQGASGLKYLHDHNGESECTETTNCACTFTILPVVHRDVAARNFLVDQTNANRPTVKLSDFGLAKDVDGSQAKKLVS